jgi:hypothetical protein
MNASIGPYFRTHRELLLAANLVVVNNKVYKDRKGKYKHDEEIRLWIPVEEIKNVSVEGLQAGTVMTYDGPDGLTVLISTNPIKFQQIK